MRPYVRPIFGDWVNPVLWALLVLGVLGVVFACEYEAAQACDRKGGTLVHTGRYTDVCFKKGIVVE